MNKQHSYINYHKHDHISSIFTPDTPFKAEDFIKRAVELGDQIYFTTNHGSGGDIFEAKTLCDKYGLRCMFGMEGYIVLDPLEKDKRNYHIIIIPTTDEARKKVNYVSSHANIDGYYYKPRIFIEDLLNLDKNDVYITTACVAGILRDDDSYNSIFKPLANHFQDHLFVEVQAHNTESQAKHNEFCVKIAEKYGLKLIAATDSHYIYPEQSKERDLYLKGKGIYYEDEDSFILDYPDGNTLYERFVKQGILSEEQIIEAMNNTFIFEGCEEIKIDKEIKMPTIYPELTSEQKVEELRRHVDAAFEKIRVQEHIPEDKIPQYEQRINEEMKVIEDTACINMPDYFLLNERIVDLAVNKYGGVLTRTGRGSCGSFYLNKLLGMTQIDALTSPVPLYSSRFISTSRCLENRSMADIDYNVVSQKPFQDATKELLGEHGCYPMVAYGTMELSEAFRNTCRASGLVYAKYNEIAKAVETYANNEEWKPYIEEAEKFRGAIVSVSPHPCAHVLDDKDLRYEYGVIRIGDALCVMITSSEADEYKVLKDDFLIVSVWKLISETFEMIGKPIMTVKELEENLDDKVWQLFRDGITATLNQVDGSWATDLVKQYKISSVREAAMFTAALRPSFDSWRSKFINRQPYSTGCDQLDNVLKPTNSYILFQENLMQFFEWLGVTPAESIGLIKKISKKKIHQEDFDALQERLHQQWIINVGDDDKFADTWDMIQSCISYGFCSAHGLATGLDMLYGAYLKSHYPCEYYTVCLNTYKEKHSKVSLLISEMKYFGIKLLPPNVNKSKEDFSASNGNILYGLAGIVGVGNVFAETIINEREANGAFKNLEDFINRTNPTKSQMVALIKSGAIPTKNKKNLLIKYFKSQYETSVFKPVATLPTKMKLLTEWDIDVEEYKVGKKVDKETVLDIYNKKRKEKFDAEQKDKYQKYIDECTDKYLSSEDMWEFETIQTFLSDSDPFEKAYAILQDFSEVEIGEKCVIVGVISKVQKKKTKTGQQFAYVNIYSNDGLIEIILWANTLQKFQDLIVKGQKIAVLGKKDGDDKIIADKLKSYDQWLADVTKKRYIKF